MQTTRIVQAVVLMMIVAVAASCSASKEYTSKLFAPRNPAIKDSQAVALRFLELDKVEPDQENWVTTDIIMGRDTLSKTLALDKLAQVFPASPISTEALAKTEEPNTSPVPAIAKPVAAETKAITKKNKNKTKSNPVKTEPVPVETKPETAETESVPVAKNINSEEVRTKRTRDE
jgi:hypothetical protein